VRIALDYYRILGIPIQVTDEQLNQAYCDRGLQLPRREYSERAISSRKQLLDKAYNALENAEKRAQYELELQGEQEPTKSEESDSESLPEETEASPKSVVEPFVPTIEISPSELVGSLLILQDLGEYEQIINLGYSCLNKPEIVALEGDDKTFQAIRKDLVLLIALAYWELCRGQWHEKAYETAAALGTKGLELLEKENLFPGVRAEIRAELYKLRPYRILDLLTHGNENKSNQGKGIQLLKEMLQERRGIDGKGDDRSGLSVERFLQFIQQIRVYLTAQEQQEIFEVEAQRPSAVGKYLAVYALIARGFAEKQPMLIVQANEFLRQLSERQDVRLEQAISALLLGQTDSATNLLESCQDKKALAFIRDNSQGEPDLLRGLCIYGESWLQEVFPHFRDLAKRKASIKEYFDDKDVQTCLMQLPLDKPLEQQPSALDSHTHTGDTMANNRTRRQQNQQQRRAASNREYSSAMRSRDRMAGASAVGESRPYYYDEDSDESRTLLQGGRTATLLATQPSIYPRKSARFKNYADELPEVSREELVVDGYRQPALEPSLRRRKRSTQQTAPNRTELPNAPQRSPRRRSRSRVNYTKQRLIALAAVAGVGALAVGAVGWMVSQWSQNNQSPLAALKGEQLSISLSRPPLTIPSADAQVIPAQDGVLSQQEAEEVIKTWLATKSQAFGEQHQVEKLDGILTGALLTTWRDRTKNLQNSNDYWRYEHQLQVRSLKTDTQNPDLATVEASVREVANYYSNGQVNSARSYNENLIVRYELVRQQDKWLIQNIAVIK
jgi:hypothetical protein